MLTDIQLKRLIWATKAQCFYIRLRFKNGQSVRLQLKKLEQMGEIINREFNKRDQKTETMNIHGKVIWLKGA